MSKKITIFIMIVCTIVVMFIVFLNQKPQPQKYTGPVEALRVSTVGEYSTLILFAEQKGFFHNNGLDVTTFEYDSGGSSFQGFLDGKVDMATGADFVGVRNSFDHQDFKVVTSLFDSSDVFELVARKDHGINNPEDLKNKKIGLTQKTMGEFFLGMFLTSHNLSLNDTIQINGDPSVLEEAITQGTVDAVVTFHPHVDNIKKTLGHNAITFLPQGNQLLYTLLYAKTSFIEEHPYAVQRFVQALVQAEEFMLDHPEEARSFFIEHLQYSDDYIANMLVRFPFKASLRQGMLLGMEDQARWLIENKLTDKTKVPNYLDFIYFDALAKVKPEAISIFR